MYNKVLLSPSRTHTHHTHVSKVPTHQDTLHTKVTPDPLTLSTLKSSFNEKLFQYSYVIPYI